MRAQIQRRARLGTRAARGGSTRVHSREVPRAPWPLCGSCGGTPRPRSLPMPGAAASPAEGASPHAASAADSLSGTSGVDRLCPVEAAPGGPSSGPAPLKPPCSPRHLKPMMRAGVFLGAQGCGAPESTPHPVPRLRARATGPSAFGMPGPDYASGVCYSSCGMPGSGQARTCVD